MPIVDYLVLDERADCRAWYFDRRTACSGTVLSRVVHDTLRVGVA
ncbi:hypothetical protein [Amycolatopsis sp.]|jgi:hypothetical protein|nr:hypothetical protein [Amycolatopsis sp.]